MQASKISNSNYKLVKIGVKFEKFDRSRGQLPPNLLKLPEMMYKRSF